MKYNLILLRPKTTLTLVLLVTFVQKQRLKFSLEVSVPSEKWLPKTKNHRARLDLRDGKGGTNNAMLALQTELDRKVDEIVKVYNDIVYQQGTVTADEFRTRVDAMRGKNDKVAKGATLNEWVDALMGQVESGKRFTPNGTALTEGAIKRYRVVQKLVQAYSKEKNRGQDLSFESIDTRFVNEWKRWRADGATVGRIVNRPPVSSNVIRNDMKMLRMWMRESYHEGMHTNRIWESDVMRMKETPTAVFHLTPDELDVIENLDLSCLRKGKKGPKSTAHNTVRDMFLLACWTGGRISDVKRYPEIVLNAWEENGNKCPKAITYVQWKTNTRVTIPILPMAQRIIEKHNGALPKLPNDQKVNVCLKEIVKAAGIKRTIQLHNNSMDRHASSTAKVCDLVSFHTGRRTFATNIYKMDILSLAQLRSLTGHGTEAMLMKYLNVTQSEISEKATERLQEAFAQ